MQTIKIKQFNAVYSLQDNEFLCTHELIKVIPACCGGFDSEGLMSCVCQGRPEIICENKDCTGIENWEVERLWEDLY